MATFEYIRKAQGPVLAEYMADKSDVSVIIGPLGSGKTTETCQKIFNLMCDQEPDDSGVRRSRWLAVRNTYSDLIGTTIKDWRELYGELGQYKAGGMSPPEQKLNFLLEDSTTVEAEIIFLALDRPDAVKKLRGYQLTGGWGNEMKELDKSVIDMLLARCGRFPKNPTWFGLLGDSNAPDEDHWLYKLAEEEKPKGWTFFKQPGGLIRMGTEENGRIKWALNPLAENINNLPKDYYIRNARGKTDDWIAVNLANEYGYVTDGKPVFPEYYDSTHCREFEFLDNLPIYRGWDFGLTPACVLLQITPKGRMIVRHEIVANNMGADRFSDEVLLFCKKYKDYEFVDIGDPAGEQSGQAEEVSCFDVLWGKNIDIEGGPQNPTVRLDSVRYFLDRMIEGNPAFLLHPECKVLRKAMMGGYKYRRIQVTGERYTEKPDKNEFSHVADALQYPSAYIRGAVPKEPENYDDYRNSEGVSRVGGY